MCVQGLNTDLWLADGHKILSCDWLIIPGAATQGLNWTTSGCGHYAGVTIVTLATSLVSSLASRKLAA